MGFLFRRLRPFHGYSEVLSVSPKVYQPDSVIEARAGEVFAFLLDSNATTGYRWELAETPDARVVMEIGSEYLAPDESIPGRGGQEKWTFKAVSAGTATLKLQYVRSWEPNAPAKTITYTVKVH